MLPCNLGLVRILAHFLNSYKSVQNTVMFLSFRTDRSGQTLQTQIRLLLIRVYTVCNSLCIFWMHYSKENPSCSTFRMIRINFQVSKILGVLWYRFSDKARSKFILSRIVYIPILPEDHITLGFSVLKCLIFTVFLEILLPRRCLMSSFHFVTKWPMSSEWRLPSNSHSKIPGRLRNSIEW